MDFFKGFGDKNRLNKLLIKYRKKIVFGKGFLAFLFNESFIIKRGIYNAINNCKGYITGDVLDFGCGEKPYKNIFDSKKYIGVDYKSSGHDNSMNDIDIYWDGKIIPVKDEIFDSFICSEVLEHVFDIENTLNEIERVLKKGGYGIITIPFILGEHEIPYDFGRYTYYGIEDILKRHNFKIIKHERLGNTYTTLLQLHRLNIGTIIKTILKFIKNKYIYRVLYLTLGIPFQIIVNSLSIIFAISKDKGIYLNNFILVQKKR